MLCGNNFDECSGEKEEIKRKCDTFIVCTHCLSGRCKPIDTCCVNPQVIFVNQPDATGRPLKKPFCKNCGSTSKSVKFCSPEEHLELELVTSEQKEFLRSERYEVQRKFRKWLDERKRTETTPLEEEYSKEYKSYLATPEWKEKRDKVIKRDKNICQSCLEKPAVDVHHLSYDRIYNEPLFDLISVCRDCHTYVIHKKERV